MNLRINGKSLSVPDQQKDRSLLEYLREELDLIAAKNACGIGACGACTVLLDKKAVRACTVKLSDIDGRELLTLEGLAGEDGALHPLQQCFMDYGAVQCGFCTPGMILSAHALLLKNPSPSREEIRTAIRANLCRCTGYQQIIDAIEAAAPAYQSIN